MLIRIFFRLFHMATVLLRFGFLLAPFIYPLYISNSHIVFIQEHLASALNLLNFQGISYADSFKEHFSTIHSFFNSSKLASFLGVILWGSVAPFVLFYPEIRNQIRRNAYGAGRYYASHPDDEDFRRRMQEEEDEEYRKRNNDELVASMTPGTFEYMCIHGADHH